MRQMRRLLHRRAVTLGLALLAAAVATEQLITLAQGAGAPGWSHWLCSPTLRSAVRTVRSSSIPAEVLAALEVHWPHFLPVLAGLATLVYLWRADVRHRSQAQPAAVIDAAHADLNG
jgi:hypothetical protein